MSSNDQFEDRLRQVLLAEAQTVTPAGDGLSQIRAKVARRDRLRWLRPGLAVATVAGLAGVAVFAASLTDSTSRTLKQDRQPATQPPSSNPPASTPPALGSPSPAPATDNTSPPQPAGRAAYTIWPFTSLADAQAWQRSGTGSWHRDAAQTALRFMGFLQAAEVDRVLADQPETTSIGTGRKVTLGRKLADGTVAAVTVVHLVRLGSGSSAPYAVTVAGAYRLAITAPEIAAPVRSPLAVEGTITGVDESVRVELRTLGRAAPISAPAAAMGGTGTPWQTSVSFPAPPSGTATLVARTDSAAGDGVVQIAARPVLFGAAPAAYPPSFVAASAGRIAVFDSTTGRLLRYLTTQQPGGGDSEPTVTADRRWVYYVHGNGTCSAGILRVPYAGGSAEPVVNAGGAVDSIGVGANGQRVAFLRHACDSSASALVTMDRSTRTERSIQITSEPPGFLGKPSWAPDGRHLAITVTGGVQFQDVRIFDTTTATTVADGKSVPCPANQPCRQSSPGYDLSGRLAYLVDHGSGGTMVRLDNGRLTTLFALSSSTLQSAVDIDSSGAAAIWRELHADSTSTLMRWGGGKPNPIPGSAEAPAW
ncbi:MAG: Gmad2 immunoglobulin-like domain-containing protein [Mycobacteriales bacterium]